MELRNRYGQLTVTSAGKPLSHRRSSMGTSWLESWRPDGRRVAEVFKFMYLSAGEKLMQKII